MTNFNADKLLARLDLTQNPSLTPRELSNIENDVLNELWSQQDTYKAFWNSHKDAIGATQVVNLSTRQRLQRNLSTLKSVRVRWSEMDPKQRRLEISRMVRDMQSGDWQNPSGIRKDNAGSPGQNRGKSKTEKTSRGKAGKVCVKHFAGPHGKFVYIHISRNALPAHIGRHGGDERDEIVDDTYCMKRNPCKEIIKHRPHPPRARPHETGVPPQNPPFDAPGHAKRIAPHPTPREDCENIDNPPGGGENGGPTDPPDDPPVEPPDPPDEPPSEPPVTPPPRIPPEFESRIGYFVSIADLGFYSEEPAIYPESLIKFEFDEEPEGYLSILPGQEWVSEWQEGPVIRGINIDIMGQHRMKYEKNGSFEL